MTNLDVTELSTINLLDLDTVCGGSGDETKPVPPPPTRVDWMAVGKSALGGCAAGAAGGAIVGAVTGSFAGGVGALPGAGAGAAAGCARGAITGAGVNLLRQYRWLP